MSFHPYNLTSKYVFCTFPVNYKIIVKMYFIEGMPFTYDKVEKEELEDVWIRAEAALNPEFTMEQVDQYSDYLIAEELHPCLYPVEMTNPELMPDDTFS
jgi:hypothetical protein|tara:strand:- start:230 stop:526 length:297 start_codon:yes stop_codon:yes gene_type:complete